MKYTFLENKIDSKYNKYKLFEYNQFDDEDDEEDDEVENIDQEKIEQMSYICNNIEQLFDKLFYEDNSLEEIEKYIRINKRLLNEIYRNNTLLIKACYNEEADIVKLLLKYGAEPNIREESGFTALMEACRKGYKEIVKILLEHGADPNIRASRFSTGVSALTLANDYEYDDIANMLVEHGASYKIEPEQIINRIYKNTSDSQIINYLKYNFSIPNIEDNRLHIFSALCFKNRIKVIKWLFDNGYSINKEKYESQNTPESEAPLIICLRSNYFELFKYLLNKISDINGFYNSRSINLLKYIYRVEELKLIIKKGYEFKYKFAIEASIKKATEVWHDRINYPNSNNNTTNKYTTDDYLNFVYLLLNVADKINYESLLHNIVSNPLFFRNEDRKKLTKVLRLIISRYPESLTLHILNYILEIEVLSLNDISNLLVSFDIIGNYKTSYEQHEACTDLRNFLIRRILNNKSSEKSIEELVKILFYSKEYKNYFYPYQKSYLIAKTINVISNKILKLILLSGNVKEILSEREFNQSLVYYIIKEKGVDFVKSLINDKENNSEDISKNISSEDLLNACRNLDYKGVKKLLDLGVDVNATSEEYPYGNAIVSLLNTRAENNTDEENSKAQVEILKLLIKKGININKDTLKNLSYSNSTSIPKKDNIKSLDVIKMLIKQGVDVDFVTNYNEMPFISYCLNIYNFRDINFVKLLCSHIKDVDVCDHFKRTTLCDLLARDNSNNILEIVKILIRKGADVNKRDMWNQDTPFSNAIKRIFMFEKEDSGLEFEIIKEIVDAGADVNNVVEGYSGLIYLIAGAGIIAYKDTYKNKNKTNTIIELIKLFMEKGDNINETDPKGRSPLFYAVHADSKEVVSFLLKHGADINIEDNEGETVFEVVKSNAVRKLLEKYRK